MIKDSFSDILNGVELPTDEQVRKETGSYRKSAGWKNPEAKRKRIARAQQTKKNKGLITSDEQRLKIYYDQFESKDRLFGYRKQVAKEIKLDETSVAVFMDPQSVGVSLEQHQRLVEKWQQEVAVQYIVRTPGNDLLEIYDAYNESLGGNKNQVPPSVVYDLRFNSDLSAKTIRSRIAQYFPHRYLESDSLATYRTKKMSYLTNTASETHIFYRLCDAADFLTATTGWTNRDSMFAFFEDGLFVGTQRKLAGYVLEAINR